MTKTTLTQEWGDEGAHPGASVHFTITVTMPSKKAAKKRLEHAVSRSKAEYWDSGGFAW